MTLGELKIHHPYIYMLAQIRTVDWRWKWYNYSNRKFSEDGSTLSMSFTWSHYIEGHNFWSSINRENFEPFYKKYPEPRKEFFFYDFQKGQYNGIKIPKDIRWIDQYLTKDGDIIPGACLLTYYAEMLDLGWKPVDKAKHPLTPNKKMIQKTDLRIGNHLQYFIGEEGCDWDNTKIDWQDLKWCDEKNENFNQVHKGIPITETILGANNFVFDGTNTGNWWMNLQTHYLEMISAADGWYPLYAQVPEFSSEAEQRVGLQRIEYIHELENLFFVLTGKELNIQL